MFRFLKKPVKYVAAVLCTVLFVGTLTGCSVVERVQYQWADGGEAHWEEAAIDAGLQTQVEEYYYDHLPEELHEAYREIYVHLMKNEDEGSFLSEVSVDDFWRAYYAVLADHPEIFWATGYKYRYYPESANLVFLPEYLFEKSKIREHQKAMKARVEKLARAAQNLSEWEKEKYIHDFICENVHYDKLKKPYSHEIIGPLGQGVGVCEGIAKSVKVLCDALGVWCVIALCGNCPEKGIKYRHTWNIVKIGGQYYHLDATFDNTLGAGAQIRYDYFNLCDKSVFRDHQPLIAPAPECTDAAHFYYREKKLSFTKVEGISPGRSLGNC